MNWEDVFKQIPSVAEKARRDFILGNSIIKDGIFKILEKHCVVVYYPFEDESKTRGFHIKRFLKGKLADFVYINTARSSAEQIFAAAHELGHVWEVAKKIWETLEYKDDLTEDIEETIVNRFAAELLMPEEQFERTFWTHMRDMGYDPQKIRLDELVRVVVMQMTDYMAPYESVRRRLVETKIVSDEIGKLLISNSYIESLIGVYLKDLNTTFSESTGIKTIPGLRDTLAIAEKEGNVDDYLISKVKKDFEISEISTSNQTIDISGEDE